MYKRVLYILYYFVSQFSVLYFALAYSESSRVSEDTIYTWKFFGVFRNSSDFRLRRNLFLFFFSLFYRANLEFISLCGTHVKKRIFVFYFCNSFDLFLFI